MVFNKYRLFLLVIIFSREMEDQNILTNLAKISSTYRNWRKLIDSIDFCTNMILSNSYYYDFIFFSSREGLHEG